MRTVVEAWADRTAELSALPHVRSVFCFENRGREIGVTLAHPHGQIYAYPYVPPRTAQHTAQAAAHHARTGRDLLGDVLAAEVAQRAPGRRARRALDGLRARPRPAGRSRSTSSPTATSSTSPSSTTPSATSSRTCTRTCSRRLDGFFVGEQGEPITLPYIAGWFAAPVGPERDGERDALPRLHLQVFSVLRAAGKLKYLAGLGVRAGRLGVRHHARAHRRPAPRAAVVVPRGGRRRTVGRSRRPGRASDPSAAPESDPTTEPEPQDAP